MMFLVPPVRGNPLAVSVVEPADKSIVGGKWVTVVIALNGQADRVVITRNKKETQDVVVSGPGKYLCRSIDVDIGLNEIQLKIMKGGSLVDTKEISVF